MCHILREVLRSLPPLPFLVRNYYFTYYKIAVHIRHNTPCPLLALAYRSTVDVSLSGISGCIFG